MDYQDRKERRIEYLPPIPLKRKIDLYAQGNRQDFLNDAVKEKIARLEAERKENNGVKNLLR